MIIKNFSSYIREDVQVDEFFDVINEGFFDKLFAFFTKIAAFFKSPDKIKKSVEAVITDSPEKTSEYLPKSTKVNDSVYVLMGDGKDSSKDFVIAFTKLADLPDNSGIFQITASTNTDMLKALTGSELIEDLVKNSVMAMIPAPGLKKGEVMTIKILKNVIPDGKNYSSKTLVQGIGAGFDVSQKMSKLK